MRVAAYVRVSTSRQVKLETIEQQLEMVRKYAREKGWELPEEKTFRDDGYSGTTLKRPALDALRDKTRLREFEVVVVASPDRLARNYVHQMVLIEELEKVGCRVEFVERPMSSEPNDQLLLQIRGAVAEYERTLLSERMRRGRLAKYKAGLLLPWTHTPYGLRVDPDRPRDPAGVRPDEAKAAVVAEIFAAYLEPGATLFGVSRHLREMGVSAPRGGKAWSTATLRGILTNPVYAGKVYAGRVRYRPARIRRSATHPIGHPHDSSDPLPPEEWIFIREVPALVSQEQFDLVAGKLSKNKSFARRNNKANEHLLRALVSCGECMLASIACARTGRKNKHHRKQRYYVCSGKFSKAHTTPEEKCPSRYAPAEQLDEIVWKDLCEVLTHPESITEALRRAHGGEWLPQELKARQENLRQGRSALGRQLERLTEAYLGEVIPLARIPQAPRGPRTKRRSSGVPGEAASGPVPPAHGTRRSGRLHRGLLREGARRAHRRHLRAKKKAGGTTHQPGDRHQRGGGDPVRDPHRPPAASMCVFVICVQTISTTHLLGSTKNPRGFSFKP